MLSVDPVRRQVCGGCLLSRSHRHLHFRLCNELGFFLTVEAFCLIDHREIAPAEFGYSHDNVMILHNQRKRLVSSSNIHSLIENVIYGRVDPGGGFFSDWYSLI